MKISKFLIATIAGVMLLTGCSDGRRFGANWGSGPYPGQETESKGKSIFSESKPTEKFEQPTEARVEISMIDGKWMSDECLLEVRRPNTFGMIGASGFATSSDCQITDESVLYSDGSKAFDYIVVGDHITITVNGNEIEMDRATDDEYQLAYDKMMEAMWGDVSEAHNYSGASAQDLSNFTITYEGPYSTTYEENFTKYEIDVWKGENLSMEDIRSGKYSSSVYPLTGDSYEYTIGSHEWVVLPAGSGSTYKYFCYPKDTHEMSAEVSDYYGYTIEISEICRLLEVFFADK